MDASFQSPSLATRSALLRRGYALEILTVAWNVVEGVIGVTAGILAGSVALLGFGLDSFIETASGAVVGWRLREEMLGRRLDRIEHTERRTARVAGGLLLALACYISIDAASRLFGLGRQAEESLIGIVLTAVSLAAMPVLGWVKLRTARQLGSGALRADAYETITCAWLSAATLSGLLLNARLGWWWADPAAALVLVPLIVREGWEGWRGEHCRC